MRLEKDKITPVVLVVGLALWLLFNALQDKDPDTFRYSLVAGGFGGAQWAPYVEYVRLNGTMSFPLQGPLDGGWPDRTIFASSMGLHKPSPVPYQVDARWFSYQNEQFYQINLEIPEEKQQAVRDFYRQYPERNYTHSLQLGMSGEGDLRLYWEAFCSMIEGCPSEPRKQLELYDRVSAQRVDENFSNHMSAYHFASTREDMVCRGLFAEEARYELPEAAFNGSQELNDYKRLRVRWGAGYEEFTYILSYRDGSESSGQSIQDGRRGLVEWEDAFNPPHRIQLFDKELKPILDEVVLSFLGFQSATTKRSGYAATYQTTDDSGYIYLDQRFLLPSREHFEWPQWAQEMRWQDFRPECKISTYVRLRDVDGVVVAGGVYELIDNETGEVLMKERTDMQGFTRVRRSDYLSNDWSFQ